MVAARVVVIGAGVGGLVSALLLATRGVEVTLLERATVPGGKIRQAAIGEARIDAGPTVFTMPWVFEEIFAEAGEAFTSHLKLQRSEILARHAWRDGEQLDLYADLERSTDVIGRFAGAREAAGYRKFCKRARAVYETLEEPYIRSATTSPQALIAAKGLRGIGDLWRIAPFSTLMRALGEYFHDPRLLQLFGRYATYCGSSPYLAPATLMLVAHVERSGVWLIDGGMQALAQALADLAHRKGARLRYGTEVSKIEVSQGRVYGVLLKNGEHIAADTVIVNADVAALASGLFGPLAAEAVSEYAVPTQAQTRSLSALTWAIEAKTTGFPLLRHNVFFSSDYAAEFKDIFEHGRLPHQPTVYVCAQDRSDTFNSTQDVQERLLCLINAPANGDVHSINPQEMALCEQRTFSFLERCGLYVDRRTDHTQVSPQVTTPRDFHRLFPATGGALYGPPSHGWKASFRRPGSRTRIPGLYLAGGSTHPGPGVPMAALSGRLAAHAVMSDHASTSRSLRTATSGGTSMPPATTDNTR